MCLHRQSPVPLRRAIVEELIPFIRSRPHRCYHTAEIRRMLCCSAWLIATEVFPVGVVKMILHPGAVLNGLVRNMSVPRWDDLLDIYNLTSVKEASPVTDLQRVEILARSYFAVAGSIVGLLKPGRMSMFGTLLIMWGLVKEGLLGKPATTDPAKAIYIYPTMMLAIKDSLRINKKKTFLHKLLKLSGLNSGEASWPLNGVNTTEPSILREIGVSNLLLTTCSSGPTVSRNKEHI